jgi:hypothetical protein
MLESQDHVPQLLFDDPSFDTDALSAAALLGIGRTRLSQITSAGSLPYLRRKVGDRFRVFYRRSDLEKRVALRYSFAHPTSLDQHITQISAENRQSDLRAGASAHEELRQSDSSGSESSVPALVTGLLSDEMALPKRDRPGIANVVVRRSFVSAAKLETEDKLIAALERMESLLINLTENVREIDANHTRGQEDALQTRREHQHELHLLARLIRANRPMTKTESLKPAHEQAIDSKLETSLELKTRKLRMRANAQQRSVSRKISARKNAR